LPDDHVAQGRDALARGAWEDARRLFAAALEQEETAEALEGAGTASWWLDDAPAMFDARERAYGLYRGRGDAVGAARVATALAWDYLAFRGERAVAQGWLQRAHRLLADVEPVAEHGWLALREASLLLGEDPERARALSVEAAGLGRTLGDVDLEMTGHALEGLALVSQGEVAAGMALLDESTAAAVAGEMEDFNAVGLSCCYLIYACERVQDYDRAAQWCEHLSNLSERRHVRALFAVCRTHYAGVLTSRGAWADAEEELRFATAELAAIRPPGVDEGLVRLAELRRRQGRAREAEDLLRDTELHPVHHLVAGELSLDAGEAAAAIEHAERFLRRRPGAGRTERAPGLQLLVRAQLAAGVPAVEALAELEGVALSAGTEPLRASAGVARGLVAAAEGRSDDARTALEDAVELYRSSRLPFEEARARLALADVLRAAGRAEAADEQAQRAAETIARLRGRDQRERGPLTARELEVLRLVAGGASNARVAEALVVSEHTVHRHVANILRKLDVSSRAAAVARAGELDLL